VAVPVIGLVTQEDDKMRATAVMAVSLLKLRIGVAIAASALAGIAVASGPSLSWWQIIGLSLAILGASGAAGAFNHYYDRDLDRLMLRTRNRPFASGAFGESVWWPVAFLGLLAISLGLAWLVVGHLAAGYVFLGAFTYGIVYTVWLKRRSTWNIVVGGLAGSFAVLAGAAAVDPSPQVVPTVLAVVLFLWTPPHFWSLAAAKGQDYARAGIPMLPVVAPARAWTMAILTHSVVLALISLVPLWFGQGLVYGIGAAAGGGYFVWKSVKLYRVPSKANAMANFLASLVQLSLLVAGALLASAVGHWS
jgi:protoheme IX farnesyltransferase